MIDCNECTQYALILHERGEIKAEEMNKLAIDRHALKGCKKLPYVAPALILLDDLLDDHKLCNSPFTE